MQTPIRADFHAVFQADVAIFIYGQPGRKLLSIELLRFARCLADPNLAMPVNEDFRPFLQPDRHKAFGYVDADRRPVLVAQTYPAPVCFHPVWIIRRFRRLASLVVTGSLPDDSLAPLQPELLWAQRLRVVVAVDDDKLAALTRYLHIAYGERAASVLSVLVADTTLSV